MSASRSESETRETAVGQLRATIARLAHRHGLVNSFDRECSPPQFCLRCQLDDDLDRLYAALSPLPPTPEQEGDSE